MVEAFAGREAEQGAQAIIAPRDMIRPDLEQVDASGLLRVVEVCRGPDGLVVPVGASSRPADFTHR